MKRSTLAFGLKLNPMTISNEDLGQPVASKDVSKRLTQAVQRLSLRIPQNGNRGSIFGALNSHQVSNNSNFVAQLKAS